MVPPKLKMDSLVKKIKKNPELLKYLTRDHKDLLRTC